MNPIHISSETGKSICDVRSRYGGSFVGVSGWEGQEGLGCRDGLSLCPDAAYTDVDTLRCLFT